VQQERYGKEQMDPATKQVDVKRRREQLGKKG
jgi:hypothetical protein